MVFDELNYDGEDVKHCIDIGNHLNCRYYTPEQLQSLNSTNSCSFLHLNIRSLCKHHEELATLLSNFNCSFDVIGCSETWLNDRTFTDILNLDGYKLIIKNRLGRTGGGVCLYVHSRYQINVCDDIVLDDNHSDSLFVEINLTNAKKIIVGVIYRPPDSDLDVFEGKLEDILFSINKKKQRLCHTWGLQY